MAFPAAQGECTFPFGLTLTADDIENTLLERVASRLRPEDVAQMTHKLLLHMILDVPTLQLVNMEELMEEAQMSEYQAQALLIPRDDEWNAWRRTRSPLPGSFEASLRAPDARRSGVAPRGAPWGVLVYTLHLYSDAGYVDLLLTLLGG